MSRLRLDVAAAEGRKRKGVDESGQLVMREVEDVVRSLFVAEEALASGEV